ncbi:MAG: Clp1/GlmU family protein, partial [Acidilobaceae archaeon]
MEASVFSLRLTLMVRMRLDMSPGDLVRVFGPAVLNVENGRVSVLGAELSRGGSFTIGKFRSYVVKGLEPSAVEVELSEASRVEIASPEEEPYDEWVDVADSIVSSCSRPCTVMVLGPVDAGKSSFAALLANRSLASGLRPAIIDADVGQADVGPPGFVGLAMPSTWVSWIRELEPLMLRFVGSIEPSPLVGRIIASCVELKSVALGEGADIVVVDTDGWIEGWSALEYKLDLSKALGAEHAVVLGYDELAAYMAKSFPGHVYRLVRPMVQAVRDSEDRKKLRQANYRRFLEGDTVEVDLGKVAVQGSFLSGYDVKESLADIIMELQDVEVVNAMKYPGGVCIYVKGDKSVPQHVFRELQKRVREEVIIVSE